MGLILKSALSTGKSISPLTTAAIESLKEFYTIKKEKTPLLDREDEKVVRFEFTEEMKEDFISKFIPCTVANLFLLLLFDAIIGFITLGLLGGALTVGISLLAYSFSFLFIAGLVLFLTSRRTWNTNYVQAWMILIAFNSINGIILNGLSVVSALSFCVNIAMLGAIV